MLYKRSFYPGARSLRKEPISSVVSLVQSVKKVNARRTWTYLRDPATDAESQKSHLAAQPRLEYRKPTCFTEIWGKDTIINYTVVIIRKKTSSIA